MSDLNTKKCVLGFFGLFQVRWGPFLGKCWLGADAEEVQNIKTKPKHTEGM